MEETFVVGDEMLVTAEEIAYHIGVSVRTIDLWYKWKRRNPNHPLAKLLHDPTRINKRRYWKAKDVTDIEVFQNSIPRGPGGLFAEITYHKKENKQ